MATQGEKSSWYKNYFKKSSSSSTEHVPPPPPSDLPEVDAVFQEVTVITNGDAEEYLLIGEEGLLDGQEEKTFIADVANEEEVTSVQQEDEGEEAKTEPRFEETLADYQPPKRYVKEERKETAKAPKVMIMEEVDFVFMSEQGLNNESTSRSSTSSQSKYGAPLQMSREESENEATEIIRADDLVKDDREDLPSIGNIKSHFEQISDQTQSQDESMITKTSSSTDGVVTTIVKRSGSHNSEGETNRSRSTSQSRVGGSESRSRGNSESESRQAAKQAKIGSKTTVSSSESRIVNKDSKHSTIESHKSGNVEDEQEIYREGTKEVIINPDEIPKEGLVGLRTKYEQEVAGKLSNEDGGPSLSRKASKWDKPKDPAPPPINRKEGDEDTDSVFSEVIAEELPPSAMTRTLVTRFRSFEEGEEQLSIERKGVRRMTPPRDEMHASLAAYRKSVEEKQIVRDPNIIISGTKDEYEKELPPPKFAKSMLTKFKSLELEDAPPPSPLRSEQVATLARQASTTKQTSQAHTSAMTDSGICIEGRGEISMSDPIPSLRHEEVIEGGIFENKPVQSQGVVREADSPNEEELPESGIAKNLLNQWRSVETVETFVPAEYSSTSSGHKPSARYSHECRVGSQAVENGEVIRESDQNEEEFLPPRGLSKNLTAKFKSLEEQNKELGIITPVDYSIHAYRNSSSARYTHECRMGTPTQSMEGLAVIRESDRNEEEFLPPPGMSKSLMTKFKSIEEEYKDVATFPVDFSQTSSSHSSHARISHECRMGSVSGDGELEVVRETDQNEEAFLPPSGLSKNLTAKFMTLEEQNRELAFSSTSSLNKKDLEKQQYKWNVKEVRPLTGTGKVQIIPVEKGQISEEGVENKYTFQVDRDDVQIDAHADNIELHEEELPAPSTAKKLLEKFSSFDESTAPAPTPEQSAVIQREAVKSVRTNSSRHTIVQESTESNGDFFQQEVSVHEQYIGKPESGEFENEPIVNSSVVRESDCYDEEELPEAGLTKTLRARFQE
ncbi:hypothetical protein CAPTEDRAFT_199500 [Capitella teleta]|uniref:Uncharacterized protein n=1 Tax=Capitella teleta TaxID=283909 RepID=R7VE14_CAPTE|nr:hypothetical protein CAPTEDRAFT_199500 [Capitella teleta]|eukprot:ELU14546.1 hypothetical protein CAPTEDRAFT_199500 [Capitella teleta]